MVKYNKRFLIFILPFLIGVVTIISFRIWQVKEALDVSFTPQKSSFNLAPPRQALNGKLVEAKGEVKKESREEEGFKKVEEGEEIISGEKIATGENSEAKVIFEDFVRIKLTENTEISFVSLIPSSFLVRQSMGEVTYEILKDKSPISVRSLSMLLRQATGSTKIVTDREKREVYIEVIAGQVKIAMVDLENKTHVWDIKEGEKARVDDQERDVEIE